MSSSCEQINSGLSDDPLDALEKAALGLKSLLPPNGQAITDDTYAAVCEAFGFVTSFAREVKDEVGFCVHESELGDQCARNVSVIREYADNLLSTVKSHKTKRATDAAVHRGREFFSYRFFPPLTYEFSDSDVSQINDLILTLRKLITDSSEIAESHRQRLLRRLDALQAEVGKKISNVDRVWGVTGEIWMTVKAFISNPEKANEWMTVIAKLLAIVAAAQAMAQGLPPSQVIEMLPWLGDKK